MQKVQDTMLCSVQGGAGRCRAGAGLVQGGAGLVQGGAGRCREVQGVVQGAAPNRASCLVQGGAGGAGTPQASTAALCIAGSIECGSPAASEDPENVVMTIFYLGQLHTSGLDII